MQWFNTKGLIHQTYYVLAIKYVLYFCIIEIGWLIKQSTENKKYQTIKEEPLLGIRIDTKNI